MPGYRLRFILTLLLTAILQINCAAAETAPQFSWRTLSGEELTNDSLKGNVVLVQFWATWCGYCRRDQPVVDRIEAEFASQGLVVVAVDVRESEQSVKSYLRQSPRSVRIVLDPDAESASHFHARGFPQYVLIDRDGTIVGRHPGFAGEAGLRSLLTLAGFSMPEEVRDETKRASDAHAVPRTPKLIEVPPPKSAAVPQPKRATVFLLTNGERIETLEYVLSATSLQVVVGGQRRTIPVSAIDVNASVNLNRARGIELKIPTNPNEVTL